MKTTITLFLLAFFTIGVNAQFESVTFEAALSDTSWNQFANSGDAPENMVMAANPDKMGINDSDSCIMFTVLAEADPWVGAWADLGDMEFTSENLTMYMMVYKDVITNTALKVEGGGVDPIELKVPNTVTDEWELITFDFSAAEGQIRTRLVFFPDFPDARTEGSLCYVDNIGFEDLSSSVSIKKVNSEVMSIYPSPASEFITVQFPGMTNIRISNIVGQTVRNITSSTNYIERVNVSDLKSGIYFVTLDTPEGMLTSKFMKK
jgi:hypothetical protein